MPASIDKVLEAAVDAGDVPCVVAMAANGDGEIYAGAAGMRAPGLDQPVTPDTTFRIASMTKMVTTVAALQLVERGQVALDDPVEATCAEFGQLQVLQGFDGDTPRLRPPRTPATVRQLMSHTSGLGYWFWNADIDRWEQVTGSPNVMVGVNACLMAPLVADPGTTFEYGINTDWLGKVVEAASGEPLDRYVAANILEPLSMRSTGFSIGTEQRAECVPVHGRGEDGEWLATDVDWPAQPEFWPGGHGLYCTPRDYLAFQRMLLGNGRVGDVVILDEATVDEAFSNQTGDIGFPARIETVHPELSADFCAGPGYTFGLGLLLNTEQQPGMRAPGSGAWAGIFNSHFWVDRTSGISGAIYTQTLPFVEPRVFQVYMDFERALYAASG